MSYSVLNGYAPRDYNTILRECVDIVNQQFNTSYTPQSFTGTNMWKFLYTFIQEVMQAENKAAEIEEKLEDYIRTQNEKLLIHRSSVSGFMQATEQELGLISSIKPIESAAEAGKPEICVDVDETAENYAETKQKIFDLMHECLTAGLFYQGDQTGTVTAENGQQFNYAFSLPTKTPLKIKIEIKVSDNNNYYIDTALEVKEKFLKNFNAMYRLGYDFEPQQYLTIERDLNFAGEIKTTWSTNNGTSWSGEILQGVFDEKLTISADNVEVDIK